MSEIPTKEEWTSYVTSIPQGDNNSIAQAFLEAKNNNLYPVIPIPHENVFILVAGGVCILQRYNDLPEGYGRPIPDVEYSIITPEEARPLIQRTLEDLEQQAGEVRSALSTLSSVIGDSEPLS